MKYMTKEWYAQLQIIANTIPFDKKLIKQAEMIVAAYDNEYKKNFPNPPKFMETVGYLHDCELVSAEFEGSNFIITIDICEWGIDGHIKIILKNATLKKKDFDHQELGWCYEELYPSDLGYELHVLLFEYGSEKMYDFIAECENIVIEDVK